MPHRFSCPFSIASSHEIHEVGFRGGNTINLVTPLSFKAPLGLFGTSLHINNLNDKKYTFIVLSEELTAVDDQVNFIEKVTEFLSFLIGHGEANPHFGTSFIKPIWLEFKSDYITDDNGEPQGGLKVTEALEIESTRKVDLTGKHLSASSHTDMLRFYVDGLRAAHAKSKYFHWFLILEYLENSDKYAALFNANKLFNATETNLIKEVADKLDGPKKGALLNLLERTKEFRNGKLVKMLHTLGITKIQTHAVTEEMIKGITNGRNALFHSGSGIPENVLWQHLFPLVTLVVEHVSANPTCLDA